MRLLLQIALSAGVAYWASTDVDPLICFAVYCLGVMVIDDPRRLIG